MFSPALDIRTSSYVTISPASFLNPFSSHHPSVLGVVFIGLRSGLRRSQAPLQSYCAPIICNLIILNRVQEIIGARTEETRGQSNTFGSWQLFGLLRTYAVRPDLHMH